MSDVREEGVTPLVGHSLPLLTKEQLRSLASALLIVSDARQHDNLTAELVQSLPMDKGIATLHALASSKAELKLAFLEPLLPALNSVVRYLNAGAPGGANFVGYARTVLEMVKAAKKDG